MSSDHHPPHTPVPERSQVPDSSQAEIRKTNPAAHSGAREQLDKDPAMNNRICNSNRTAHSGARQLDDDCSTANGQLCNSNPTAPSGARPPQDEAAALEQLCKTDPTAHSGAPPSLSARQLAALRLLARGHGSMRVAQHLQINRHTIARWKRNPAFAAELKRMVETLTQTALHLRAESRMHRYSLYRAGVEEWRERG